MAVDRCVCHKVSLARLKALDEQMPRSEAQTEADRLRVLSHQTGAGTGCGTCVPYIELMLRTGRTVFEVLPVERRPLPQSEEQPPS